MSKNFFISTAVMLVCLFLVAIFPTKGVFQEIAVSAAFFLALPMIAIKYLLKKSLREYGFCLPKLLPSLFWMALSLFIGALCVFILSRAFSVFDYFFPPELPSLGFGYFLLYCAIIGMLSLFYEVFFRGLVMSAWRDKMGRWTILAQWALFALFLFASGSLKWEWFPFLCAAPLSGVVFYFTRSLLPSLLFSWIFVILITVTASRFF